MRLQMGPIDFHKFRRSSFEFSTLFFRWAILCGIYALFAKVFANKAIRDTQNVHTKLYCMVTVLRHEFADAKEKKKQKELKMNATTTVPCHSRDRFIILESNACGSSAFNCCRKNITT